MVMNDMQEKVNITTEYITLGQLIKVLNILESGGMVKAYIKDVGASVNGELEHRRGRKLYPGDTVEVEGKAYIISAED